MRVWLRRGASVCALALLAGCAAPGTPRGDGGASGTLRIGSTPAGARIIVDDTPTNFRTPTAFPLAAGSHRVILSLAAHRNWESRVRIEPDTTTQLEASLVALGTGSIGVASTPPGAQILIDGEPTGLATAATVPRLPVGTHTVQLRLEGYEPWSQAVVVRSDRHFPFQALLSPSRRNLGKVNVQSHPPHALITLDGVASGKITPECLTEVPAGIHLLELSLAGYRPWSGTVVVEEGRARDLLVTLRRLPAQEAGQARIESEPPGASITLDGVLLEQKSPASLDGLPPGTFTVEVNRPGSKRWRGELTVLSGERTLLQVVLEPSP
ncbi:MAG TPA: PEGA domain-containing protein [Candidatus Methanoperedens sp.]|nr:PEGA domain-containing protein [Candidatus Methanoperedens sp.]